MLLIKNLQKIRKMNFNAQNIVLILYFEKISFIKWTFKILRKITIQMFYNCEIYPESFVSVNSLLTLRLPHPYLIIIHKNARMGENVTIFQGVTIGVVERFCGNDVIPVIGNNVYIGCKATILSASIADNCIIGAHTLVLKSVSEPQTIVGVWK
jgi:serine O-acetyltransferase